HPTTNRCNRYSRSLRYDYLRTRSAAFLLRRYDRRYDEHGLWGRATMTGYQIQGPARHCAASGRELRPGERFYSALLEEAGRLVRKVSAAEAWSAPPAGAVAYWCGRIPASGRPRQPTINDELLIDCFEHLGDAQEPAQRNFRYVVALLLMRRKRF